jgi:transposase-like protein
MAKKKAIKQICSLYDLLKKFPTEKDCIEYFEQIIWYGKPVSPFDETSKVYKCSGNKYKCKKTGKYFNIKNGTIFENSNIKLQKWLMAIYLMTSHKKGISSIQLARDIGVTQKSSWFMLHRLRYAMAHRDFKKPLSNIVECDEAYIGGKEKNRHQNKKGRGQGSFGREALDKATVFGAVERGGKVLAEKIVNANKENIEPIIFKNIKEGTKIFTDEWYGYHALSKSYEHKSIKHSLKQYVDGEVHTNTIENFWACLKRGLYGIYHKTDKAHLQWYLDEFAFRYNTRDLNELKRCELFIGATQGRLKYRQLIKKKSN